MKAFLILMLISMNAFAIDWNEMESGKTYTLKQNLSLKQNERSGSLLEIMKGEKLTLKEVIALGSVPVLLYSFDYKNCPGPAITTDMEIIPVTGTNPVVEIGAELAENCELNIYLETKDMISVSTFE